MRSPVVALLLLSLLPLSGCSQSHDNAEPRSETTRPDPAQVQRAPTPGAPQPAAEPPSMLRRAPIDDAPRTALAPRRTTPAKPPFTTIRVFYGTNRAHTGRSDPCECYAGDPGGLTFGFCDVSIPRGHDKGELESPRLWKFEFREDPNKHIVLMSVQPASGPEFITALQKAVWDSIEWTDSPEGMTIRGGEAFVFVHGFNNSFEDAARRTAQIAHDLDFRGAPIMYSWPSQTIPTLTGYEDDARRAGWSERHFLAFLAGVARDSGARRIHVIAHSMGNRIVTESLRKLSWHVASGQLPKFNQVILTAPDIDADYFKVAIAPRITQTADRITIYSSTRDIALKASNWVNKLSTGRLGEIGPDQMSFTEFENIDLIDASFVETDLFSLRHAYHADSPTVLTDIEQVLRGLEPAERGLKALWNNLGWQIRSAKKQLYGAMETMTR